MPKLTKREIDAALPRETPYILWDLVLTGFGLRVAPSGRKSFLVKYRAGSGRSAIQRKITIGGYGVLTPDQARAEAKRILGEVALGRDPAGHRKQAEAAMVRFDRLAELYMDQHARPKKKTSSANEDQRLLDRKLIPHFGQMVLTEISRGDVSAFHARQSATPYTANRGLALLSKMFALAEDWGLCEPGRNPCRGIQKYREEKRERFLSADELARLAKAIDATPPNGATQHGLAILRLLVMTGARKGEILSLRWDEFDAERALILKRDSKTGRKPIPISQAAAEFISQLPPHPDSPFVFPAARGDGHYQGLTKVWLDVRQRANLPETRIHDLRHTYASLAAGSGGSLPVIGRILGHTQSQTTQRYAHLADDPVRRTIEATQEALSRRFIGESDREIENTGKLANNPH